MPEEEEQVWMVTVSPGLNLLLLISKMTKG